MKRLRNLLIGVAATGLLGSGGVVAGALQDAPRDATPAPDPIGDILRDAPPAPTPTVTPPGEPAPAGETAPALPVAVVPTAPAATAEVEAEEEARSEEAADEDRAEAEQKVEEPVVPTRRQRRRVAIVEAIDKITAESMRFEVEVGGRPVRFNNALIFSARACEVSAPEELVEDAIAYMDITLQPRGTAQPTEPRQIFRGWMFASTPAVSGLQHPIYDAWIVGCKA